VLPSTGLSHVVSGMFPSLPRKRKDAEDSEDYGVLGTSLALVACHCLVLLWPRSCSHRSWTCLFGRQFGIGERNQTLLSVFCMRFTGIYALCGVMIAYEMSRKMANTGGCSWCSGFVIAGILAFISRMAQGHLG